MPAPDDAGFEHTDARSRYRVIPLGGDAVWFEFVGFLTTELWPGTEQVLEQIIRRQSTVLMLGNGWDLDGYESGYRVKCVAWFLRRRKDIRGVHVLSRSKLVNMGAQMVNLVIPIVQMSGNPIEFMKSAAREVPTLNALLAHHRLRVPR